MIAEAYSCDVCLADFPPDEIRDRMCGGCAETLAEDAREARALGAWR